MNNQKLAISGSKNTPEVILDIKHKSFVFRGFSYPENAQKFYDPIFKLAKNYIQSSEKDNQLNMLVDFDYFNTSTARMLYKIFGLFNEAVLENGFTINVEWVYESDDYDMIDSGKDFELMFKGIDFNLVEKAA